MPHSEVAYELDARDAITAVNQDWIAFARANRGEAVLPPGVLHRPVWDFIGDPSTREIYRLLFRRVRAGGAPATIRLRCDCADARRLLQMTIEPGAADALRLRTRLLLEERRPYAGLLDPDVVRTGPFVVVCSWCKRVDTRVAWREVEVAMDELGLIVGGTPPVSHGICPECRDGVLAQAGIGA